MIVIFRILCRFMEKYSPPSYRYLFGPVRSRRLGVSLGVDLMPEKTCSLDCIYCECGKTTRKTRMRKAYVPLREIQEELDAFLSESPDLDAVTFSGSGEPTLHRDIGTLIDFLKRRYPRYPVALLTNGTLLSNPEVRKAIRNAHVVIASLDAATPGAFQAINRPHSGILLSRMIQGLMAFRQEAAHTFLIEIFIVPGINDAEHEIEALGKVLEKIRPDGVHLNTLDRPGTEPWVKPAGEDHLEQIARTLNGAGVARFIHGVPSGRLSGEISDTHLLNTLRRRPFTVQDMAVVFGIPIALAEARLEKLVAGGRVEKTNLQRGAFYSLKAFFGFNPVDPNRSEAV